MVTTLRALRSTESLEAPTDSLPGSLRQSLEKRGVVLQVLPGETEPTREERIDTALMALFRDTRQTQSFDALYGRTRARVFAWVRRLLAQKHCQLDPLEVLQDTYVNVYQYSSRFRDERPESFRVWVRTIAANALRRSRSQLPRRREQPLGEGQREAIAVGVDPTWPIEQREDDRRLAQTWLLFLQHYQRAFSQLALRDRCALELVEVEGLSYAEAGSRLAVGPSNMKMIMFRARQRLLLRLHRSIDDGDSRAAAQPPSLQAAG